LVCVRVNGAKNADRLVAGETVGDARIA
jgi:hypothetical protein